MKQSHVIWIGVGCFALGALTQSALAQSGRPTFSLEIVKGKDAATAAAVLLEGALQLAEEGSWERIAIGRIYYLSGSKPEGQAIFDDVLAHKPEAGDLFRIARVYREAGDWE